MTAWLKKSHMQRGKPLQYNSALSQSAFDANYKQSL